MFLGVGALQIKLYHGSSTKCMTIVSNKLFLILETGVGGWEVTLIFPPLIFELAGGGGGALAPIPPCPYV